MERNDSDSLIANISLGSYSRDSQGGAANDSQGRRETKEYTLLSPELHSRPGHVRIAAQRLAQKPTGELSTAGWPAPSCSLKAAQLTTPGERAGHARIQMLTPRDSRDDWLRCPGRSPGVARMHVRPYDTECCASDEASAILNLTTGTRYVWQSKVLIGRLCYLS